MALLDDRDLDRTTRARLEARPLRRVLPTREAMQCRKKFLRYFEEGFRDETYVDWERGYKAAAHERWERELGREALRALLRAGKHEEVARRAVAIEARTNLLFSFEKMALRDALRQPEGAKTFAQALWDLLYGPGGEPTKFDRWCLAVGALPRKQTRVLTWPIVTVFGFLAAPERHVFLKPTVTRRAAHAYGYDFDYRSKPSWITYASLLDFCALVRRDLRDLRPRDMIDLQSFLWVQGSDEYPD